MATEMERAVIELQVLYRGIHQRLSAIERGQGISPPRTSLEIPPPARPVPPAPAAQTPDPPTPPQSPPPTPIPQQQPAPQHQAAPQPPAPPQQPAQQQQIPRQPTPLRPPESPFTTYNERVHNLLQQISDRKQSVDANLENIIGQSLLSFVGGLVLFGGILLFLRFNFLQPFLQPVNRVLDVLIAGALLLAAGQWLNHARMRPLAAAITATGIATLMASLFAANILFDPPVLDHLSAFAGLIIIGLAGTGLAFQLRMQSLAVLSLAGMYLIPLILQSHDPDPRALLAYLSLVSVLGFAICFYKRRWHWLRAVAVMALFIPHYFDGISVSYAWLLLALALALYALLTASITARAAMLAALILLTLHIFIFDSMDTAATYPLLALPHLNFTSWMFLTAGAALFSLALAWISGLNPIVNRAPLAPAHSPPPPYRRPIWPIIACVAVATLLWYVFTFASLQPLQLTTSASLLWIFALLILGRLLFNREDAPLLETIAAVLLTATCVKWALFDGLFSVAVEPIPDILIPGTLLKLPPVANLFFVNGLLIIAAFRGTRILRELGRPFFGWLVTALAFIALNVELIRFVDELLNASANPPIDPWLIKNIYVSIFCALYALGISIVGFARKYPTARYVALLLFAATVFKVLLIDMAKVDNSLRILSFLLIGVLLLIVSFLYHKTSNSPAPPQPA